MTPSRNGCNSLGFSDMLLKQMPLPSESFFYRCSACDCIFACGEAAPVQRLLRRTCLDAPAWTAPSCACVRGKHTPLPYPGGALLARQPPRPGQQLQATCANLVHITVLQSIGSCALPQSKRPCASSTQQRLLVGGSVLLNLGRPAVEICSLQVWLCALSSALLREQCRLQRDRSPRKARQVQAARRHDYHLVGS